MAPPRATAWPRSVLTDPDVLLLDDQGLYVICRVCAESYAMRGGKKPKPVKMNARYRTPAWETHKLRTRAHRLSDETLTLATSPSDSPGLAYREDEATMPSALSGKPPSPQSSRAGEETLSSLKIERNAREPATHPRTLEGRGDWSDEALAIYGQRIPSSSQMSDHSADRCRTAQAETLDQQV